MRRFLFLILVVAAPAFLLSPALMAEKFSFEYQKTIPASPNFALELITGSGDIVITSGEDDKIIIEATKRVKGVNREEAEEIADHIEIKVKRDGRTVSINTNYLFMRDRSESFWQKVLGLGGSDSFGQVDWVIRVPDFCNVTIQNTAGIITVDQLRGDLNIRSKGSEIKLTGVEGQIDVENLSGTIIGVLLFGPVTVRQDRGKIDLQFVEGDIRIKSSSADINVRQDMGSIDLTTRTGNVTLQTNLDSSKDFFIETESGNISLMIPETSSGDIRIESQSGDIRTEVPIAIKSMSRKQVEGTFGVGGVKINLISLSGDVTVAQF